MGLPGIGDWIAGHAADDLKLLVVLLAEGGDIGHRLQQQLGNHGGDAGEMAGTGGGIKTLSQRAADNDLAGKAGRVHIGRGRHIGDIDADTLQLGQIFGLGPGITAEILAGAELGRVDEDADDDAVDPRLERRHQGQMALMQRPHGGDEPDRLAQASARRAPSAQVRRRLVNQDVLRCWFWIGHRRSPGRESGGL